MSEDKAGPPHVAFVNRSYPPEPGATGQILFELSRELSKMGWHVSVVAAGYGPAPSVERRGNVEIHRVRGLPFRRKPLAYRALAYLSLYPVLAVRLFCLRRMDVLVVATDPPLFLALAVLCARFLGVPVVHWAHDLYPDLAFATGMLREDGLPGRLLKRIMAFALQRCAAVVVIGRCMSRLLENYAATSQVLIPNWADTRHVVPVPHEENIFRRAHLKGGEKFILMYSGNFGLGHPFSPILRAMQDLEPRVDTRLVLIGDGPQLSYVKAQAERLGLRRVTFLPYQDYAVIPQSLSAADIHLVSMEPALEGMLVPSKIYGVLAAGRPCFFLGPEASEAAHIVADNQAGEVLAPARYEQLGPLLNTWLDQPDRLRAAGQRARSAAEAANLAKAALAYDSVLRSVIRTR